MRATNYIAACAEVCLVAAMSFHVFGQAQPDDPLGKASLKVTGVGQAPEAQRATRQGHSWMRQERGRGGRIGQDTLRPGEEGKGRGPEKGTGTPEGRDC
jgi:hypothetical protein